MKALGLGQLDIKRNMVDDAVNFKGTNKQKDEVLGFSPEWDIND